MNRNVLLIIRFVALVLFQVLVVNHIRLGGYVHPYIYVIFILLLPINIPNWQLLLLGFGLGLSIDLFTGTPGLHAGATTLMAFCRPAILRLVSGHQKLENVVEPNLGQQGAIWFLRYTLCMVLVHHFALFFLESFSLHLILQVLLRIAISVPVSVFLIMIILYLFQREKKQESR
jgi:rod shape-determining protein MreD